MRKPLALLCLTALLMLPACQSKGAPSVVERAEIGIDFIWIQEVGQ